MNKKISVTSIFSLLALACSINTAGAQGVQNFVTNEENNIQQDMAAGAINSKQASAIQNQQAAIMSQEQQYKNQNGGNLTPQQRQQIAGEERQLKNVVNQTVYQNNPNANINRMQNGTYAGWNQNNPNWVQQQQNWRNNWNQNQNNYTSSQSNSYNGYEHHHHHRQW
jgi:hypothetical protein